MNILEISIKSFTRIILICISLISVFSLCYYYTLGGFFDSILLTLIGLSATYLILVLIVLLIKLITNILMKRKEGVIILGIVLAFGIVTGFFLIMNVIKLMLEFQD